MNTGTLFIAYCQCRTEMDNAVAIRNDYIGIGVDNDKWAKHWQRHRRLAKKIEKKIIEREVNQ